MYWGEGGKGESKTELKFVARLRGKKYLSMGGKNTAVSLSDTENDVCIDVYITLVSVTLQSTSFETPATGGGGGYAVKLLCELYTCYIRVISAV